MGKVHGSLARAGKVKNQTPKVAKQLAEDCRARFVDLSALGHWQLVSRGVAAAFRDGLRTVRQLTLDGNDLGGGDVEAFETWCEAIREHPGLQHLSLRNAGLSDGAATSLAAALRRHSVLFSVDLGLNRIGDPGAAAIIDAVGDSYSIYEVLLPGCDVSRELLEGLAAVLERNVERLRGRGGHFAQLRDLRRARAEAAGAFGAAGGTGQADRSAETMEATVLPAGTLAAVVGMPTRGTTFFESTPRSLGEEALAVPDAAASVSTAALAEDDDDDDGGVYFDAPGRSAPILAELSARIDAGWRHSTADREWLLELRQRIDDLLAHRRQERQRAEEVLERVVRAQRSETEHLRAAEDRIIRLREELALQVEATKCILARNLKEKVSLREAEGELRPELQERGCSELSAKTLESGLKLRSREVWEEVSELQKVLQRFETETERLVVDNARCRRWLHAARFETETERFATPAAVAAGAETLRAAQEAAAQRLAAPAASVAA
eukprot:TRINITY_DN67627_c0_g1_i1.p1 TRINITY_DN67627_c0_g1~~TRINITY_DN67627_c0_g1_i1.p1  ORF type:complete len:497 (-),score=156.49 TRINITY_DN67627_c0_g1_i1:67-1557(-)